MKKSINLLKIFMFLVLVSVVLSACSSKTVQNESKTSNIETSTSSIKGNGLYPDGLPDVPTVTIDTILYKLKSACEYENMFYEFTNVEFIEGKAYYIVRQLEEYPDKVVTSGWYAADVFSGEIYVYNMSDGSIGKAEGQSGDGTMS